MLPETVSYWCVLLHIHRKIQKIFILAAHLSEEETWENFPLTQRVGVILLCCDRTPTQPSNRSLKCTLCRAAFPLFRPPLHPPHPLRRIALCRGRSGQLNPQRNSQDKCPGVPEVRWVAAARRLCTLNLFNKNIPLHLCKSLICFSDHSTDPVI